MADTLTRFYGPALLSDSSSTLITVATNHKYVLRHIHISNPTGAAATVTLGIGTDAAGTRWLDAFSIPAGNTYDWSGSLVLDSTEVFKGHSGTASVLNITISGVDVS